MGVKRILPEPRYNKINSSLHYVECILLDYFFYTIHKCYCFATVTYLFYKDIWRSSRHSIFTVFLCWNICTHIHIHACSWIQNTYTHLLTYLDILQGSESLVGYFHPTSGMLSVSIYFQPQTKKGQLLKYAIMFPLTEKKNPFPLMQKG